LINDTVLVYSFTTGRSGCGSWLQRVEPPQSLSNRANLENRNYNHAIIDGFDIVYHLLRRWPAFEVFGYAPSIGDSVFACRQNCVVRLTAFVNTTRDTSLMCFVMSRILAASPKSGVPIPGVTHSVLHSLAFKLGGRVVIYWVFPPLCIGSSSAALENNVLMRYR
jgi:hypothetical protein